MYDAEFAEVYDEIYLNHKDYAEESRRIRELALDRFPAAATLLDVGCGTGEHLTYLRKDFDTVGIDIAEPMVNVAREKLGDVPVHVGDMRDFDLGATFDVICCMYSAVGYLADLAGYVAAVRTMAAHLVPGGVLIVEPWILRENWNGGQLIQATFESNGNLISRMGKWTTREGRSFIEMHYLVGSPSRVRHFVDLQELSLFSREEYETAFVEAGCSVEFLPDAYADRGVFVGVRQHTA